MTTRYLAQHTLAFPHTLFLILAILLDAIEVDASILLQLLMLLDLFNGV